MSVGDFFGGGERRRIGTQAALVGLDKQGGGDVPQAFGVCQLAPVQSRASVEQAMLVKRGHFSHAVVE